MHVIYTVPAKAYIVCMVDPPLSPQTLTGVNWYRVL